MKAKKRWKNAAVEFTAPGVAEIVERGLLKPEPGEVIVRTEWSLISTGTELTLLEGKEPPDSVWGKITRFPETPGYCAAGTVVGVGRGVPRNWIGRNVASSAWMSHAQFCRARPDQLRVNHRSIPHQQAVFSTIAEIVLHSVRRAGLHPGEAVVVYGLGLLGQLAVRFCRLCGARPVLAVDVSDYRLSCLPSDPAVIAVNSARDDVLRTLRAQTRNRMADVVFEVTGIADLIPGEFAALHEQGRFVVLSSPRGTTTFDFHDLCNRPSHTIIGTHVSSHPPAATPGTPWTQARNAELFFDWIADGELDLEPLISHRTKGIQAPAAYRRLMRDRSGAMGVLLDWRSS